MSVDGFLAQDKQAFSAHDPRVARFVFDRVTRLAERLDITLAGMERLPPGRALLVANHAFGWDVLVPMAIIAARLKRRVWVLGDKAWWKVPFVRRFAATLGVVDGTQLNANRLLQADELVLVLPGGLREAVKPRELRYQLLWGHRYGFVRAALRNRAPLVPLASIGSDEVFDFVGNPYVRGLRWLGKAAFPIPLPARILPIPHLVKPHFVIGEVIPADSPPEAEHDFQHVRRVRREVEGALHELIEVELARRVGVEL
jgi:1-acyl-sn-glycerol-3-phosphate acyltransferase